MKHDNKIMRYYTEITILPDNEMGLHFIWEKLFLKLHMCFVNMKASTKEVSVGIGLPKYSMERSLGPTLRLFGQSEKDLINLDLEKALYGLKDYLHIKSIKEVPEKVDSFSCYKRLQIKGNKECLSRRKSKRHNIDYDQALEDYKDYKPKRIKEPFVYVNSQSTQCRFTLFIKKEERDLQKYDGFSSFGLSKISTVPEF